MIDVRLYANLTPETDQGETEFHVEARPGLTVEELIREIGVRSGNVYIVMINGRGAELGSTLRDGDRLGLFPAISGG